MRILLVRHASVEYTDDTMVNRHIGLSSRGIAQAASLAALWGPPVDCLYSSPLPRARQTLEPLAARLQMPIVEDPAFVELDYRGDAAFFHEKIKSHRGFRFPGGESIDDASARFARAVRVVVARHPDATVLVGTHGTVLSEFLINQFGFPKDVFFRLSYPDVYEIRYADASARGALKRMTHLLPPDTACQEPFD